MSVDRLHFRDGSAAGEPDSGAAPRLSGRPGAWANAAWAWAWVFAGFVFSWGVVESRGATAGVASPDYLGEIRPLFRERCFACHGALKQKGGLRLDTVERMRRGGDSGPAFVARDASASALVQRIEARDAGERMPPEHEGELFSPEQISRVRAWIDAGGVGPVDDVGEPDPREHWAFRPRTRPEVPTVARPGWVRNPIDAFVARKHEEKGLEPQSEAPRDVLVRRLYVDLVGVTPTVEELGRLDGDQDAGWYERLVDRLLDDPRHGERWARHWMDIWRYSDAWGLGDQLRNSQRHIWRWRDWLVESANEDLPYDVMLRRMLAADETHPDDPGALRATGYLARNYFLFNRNHWLDEVVEHVGKGMLGLTVNCAKCHDHKYDPIPQADYYRLRAFFEPYQVRVDMIPGEPDLNRDGLPRAFDGPEVPTYRFVRGQETQPDKSVAISPGIPDLLAFRPLDIRAVRLPETAWQPERRPWVFEAYRAAARRRVETAGSVETEAWQAYARALGRLAAPQPRGTGGASGESTPAQAPNLLEAEAVWAVAEQDRVLAQAEAEGLERRFAATRVLWGPPETTGSDEGVEGCSGEAARVLAREAVRAEREEAVARARHAMAAARLRAVRAVDDDPRKAALADGEKARAAFEKAVTVAAGPVEAGAAMTPVTGAAWTPTRFLDSTRDDPRVVWGPTSSGRRKALAEWITDPRHPLTARVGVNHVWNRHLGSPLVATVFDFGRKGTPPTHPELVDWLASAWVDHGWSLKYLHRLIVTSATYRMGSSSAGAEAQASRDPDNRFLWRRPTIRMEAQVVRDSILAHAGQLDTTRGGPSVPAAAQADSKRRSLYFYHSNNERNLFLTTFDDALVKECYRREGSVVPQQALALSNSRLVHDAAGPIVTRLAGGGSGDGADAGGDAGFVRRAFRVLLGYEPGRAEVEASLRAMAAWPEAGEARKGLVWVLLNHNDFVTLR